MHSRAEATPGLVWVPELRGAGERLALDDASSRYVARVCRARVGEEVQLTDGAGAWASTRVLETRPRVTLEIERLEHSARERTSVLLCGPPEGDRADWMIEKLAELGVSVFQPIDCKRGVWDRFEQRRERWERLAMAGLRQARTLYLLEIRPPLPLEEALTGLPPGCAGTVASLGGARAGGEEVPEAPIVAGAVGPAPGFSTRELEAMNTRGWKPIALSSNRLRTETAALAWAAWWASRTFSGAAESEIRPKS